MSQTEDGRLALAAQRGDRGSLERLLRGHLPLIYGYVGQSLSGPDVDDVVQETMLRAVSALPQLREPDRFRSWLLSIAVHETRRRGRLRQTILSRSEPGVDPAALAEPTGVEEQALARAARSQQRREVAAAATWLDPDDREVLGLWWLEVMGELDRPGVAEALEISTAHAGVRLQRVRERLEIARSIIRSLVTLDGRSGCRDLRSTVAGWDGRPSSIWRKRLARHVTVCRVCLLATDGMQPPERLLAGVSLLGVPALLAQRAIDGWQAAGHAAHFSGASGPAISGSFAELTAGSPALTGATVPQAMLQPDAGTPNLLDLGSGGQLAEPVGRTLMHTLRLAAAQPVTAIACAVVAVAAGVGGYLVPAPAGAVDRPAAVVTAGPAVTPVDSPSPSDSLSPSASPSPTPAAAPRVTVARTARVTGPPPVTGPLPKLIDTAYPAPAGAVHVRPDGSDQAAGTAGAPLATVAAGIAKAPAGGTVVLHSGVYREHEINSWKRITVQPAPHAQVWLKGSLVVSSWQVESGRWCAAWDHPVPPPPYEKPEEYVDPAVPLAARREAVYRDDSALIQVEQVTAVAPGQFAVDVAGEKLCVGDDPAGHVIESIAYPHALNIWGEPAAGSVVRGIGFAHYAEQGLRIGAPRPVVERVTAVRNSVSGVDLLGLGKPVDAVVRGNVFTHNGRKGFSAHTAHRLLFEDNVVASNNTAGFRTAWDAAGIKVVTSDSVRVRNNRFVGNYAHALWLDIFCRDALVTGNHLSGNGRFGVFFEISQGALIADNVAVDNDTGIAVINAGRARVLNNTLVDNSVNIRVREDANRKPTAAETAAGASFVTSEVQIRNNLLVARAGSNTQWQLRVERVPCAVNPPLVSTLDGNGYHQDGAVTVKAGIAQPAAGGCAARTAATPGDLRGLGFENGAVTLAAPPGFVDAAKGDYRLVTDSPARGRGGPLPADVAQALAAPSDGKVVDLGILSRTPGASPSPSTSVTTSASASPVEEPIAASVASRHRSATAPAGRSPNAPAALLLYGLAGSALLGAAASTTLAVRRRR